MGALLLVAIPFALLAIVLLLCFVGCDRVFGIDHIQYEPPFTTYTPTILAEPTLVAYWELSETAGTAALDQKGGHNGTYLSQVFPDDPSLPSAASANPPILSLGQAGIVSGDRVAPFDDSSARAACIEVNGGYVSVPFDPALNPAQGDGFTIEAWVLVEWAETDERAIRVIMASIDPSGVTGYALFVSAVNNWQGLVGSGSGFTIADGPDVIFNATSHLVLTYDGSALRIFINGTQATTVRTTYQPSTQSSLFIGAGGPQLAAPRFPWVGKIQCVALYKGALSADQVAAHTANGNGGRLS
jgi:Concanavalin A-like lectin/glucanases superfamily